MLTGGTLRPVTTFFRTCRFGGWFRNLVTAQIYRGTVLTRETGTVGEE